MGVSLCSDCVCQMQMRQYGHYLFDVVKCCHGRHGRIIEYRRTAGRKLTESTCQLPELQGENALPQS